MSTRGKQVSHRSEYGVRHVKNLWVRIRITCGSTRVMPYPHSATQVSPFFANKGYHPKLEIGVENVSSYTAQQVAEDLGSLHEYLKEQIHITIEQYLRAARDRR